MLPNSFRLMRIQNTPKPSSPSPKNQPDREAAAPLGGSKLVEAGDAQDRGREPAEGRERQHHQPRRRLTTVPRTPLRRPRRRAPPCAGRDWSPVPPPGSKVPSARPRPAAHERRRSVRPGPGCSAPPIRRSRGWPGCTRGRSSSASPRAATAMRLQATRPVARRSHRIPARTRAANRVSPQNSAPSATIGDVGGGMARHFQHPKLGVDPRDMLTCDHPRRRAALRPQMRRSSGAAHQARRARFRQQVLDPALVVEVVMGQQDAGQFTSPSPRNRSTTGSASPGSTTATRGSRAGVIAQQPDVVVVEGWNGFDA
jgi:hypothetical protein